MTLSGSEWQKFRAVVSGLGEAVMVTDSRGRIVLWNHRAEDELGHPADEAVGRPCWEILQAYDSNGNRLCLSDCHLMKLVDLGEPVRPIDVRARTRDGEELLLNMSTVGVPAASDGWILIHAFRTSRAVPEGRERGRESGQRATPAEGRTGATLSNREREILKLLAVGYNTRAAAAHLRLAPDTVRNHVRNIFKKLGVHSRPAAVGRAAAERLL